MKTISIRQFAAIKRVAQNVNFAVTKRNRIAEQISKLNEEYSTLEAEIEGHEAGILALTGHTSEELVTKTVENTGKIDKDGRPIKVTKYEPKEGILVFNETSRCYEIHDDEASSTPESESCETTEVEEDTTSL